VDLTYKIVRSYKHPRTAYTFFPVLTGPWTYLPSITRFPWIPWPASGDVLHVQTMKVVCSSSALDRPQGDFFFNQGISDVCSQPRFLPSNQAPRVARNLAVWLAGFLSCKLSAKRLPACCLEARCLRIALTFSSPIVSLRSSLNGY
jgi:hypothetical protein